MIKQPLKSGVIALLSVFMICTQGVPFVEANENVAPSDQNPGMPPIPEKSAEPVQAETGQMEEMPIRGRKPPLKRSGRNELADFGNATGTYVDSKGNTIKFTLDQRKRLKEATITTPRGQVTKVTVDWKTKTAVTVDPHGKVTTYGGIRQNTGNAAQFFGPYERSIVSIIHEGERITLIGTLPHVTR